MMEIHLIITLLTALLSKKIPIIIYTQLRTITNQIIIWIDDLTALVEKQMEVPPTENVNY